jgi:hypothetical protein
MESKTVRVIGVLAHAILDVAYLLLGVGIGYLLWGLG